MEEYFYDPMDSSQFALLRRWLGIDFCGNITADSQWILTCDFDSTLLFPDTSIAMMNDSTTLENRASLGLQNITENQQIFTEILDVYPNPSKGYVTIRIALPESEKLNIQLISMTGERVKDVNLDLKRGEHMVSLDLGSYPNGMYHLLLKSVKGIHYQNIIKAE
jgi:hypothetical protein